MVSSLFFVFLLFCLRFFFFFFFFNDTATTEIYTLSLHDALPIFRARDRGIGGITLEWVLFGDGPGPQKEGLARLERSEEHTSELQSQSNLVCRLLLEKKKKKKIEVYVSTKRIDTINDQYVHLILS